MHHDGEGREQYEIQEDVRGDLSSGGLEDRRDGFCEIRRADRGETVESMETSVRDAVKLMETEHDGFRSIFKVRGDEFVQNSRRVDVQNSEEDGLIDAWRDSSKGATFFTWIKTAHADQDVISVDACTRWWRSFQMLLGAFGRCERRLVRERSRG